MSLKTTLALALLLGLSTPLFAGPGQGGPGAHGGGPGPGGQVGWGPGPGGGGHDRGLPSGARELWIGSALYFVAAGTYYLWNANVQRYEVVTPPAVVQGNAAVSYEVIAYPANGQSVDQQGRDRYECHTWAVSQSGFDPATVTRPVGSDSTDRYRRALGACLMGRGYSVN
ncbi:hypothetical protein [Pseudomonas sp. zfem005]|uniref:hypothetical protein n=1 Tax=Pseudomonas sp. zfem005 TaxID=3078200 RepID=UPI002928AFB2|nr:hypothetical protein [Pseudomonas sp. zfem005]MDU9412895.1 hypothetical protein [Pseudomonas sp. zfem005]